MLRVHALSIASCSHEAVISIASSEACKGRQPSSVAEQSHGMCCACCDCAHSGWTCVCGGCACGGCVCRGVPQRVTWRSSGGLLSTATDHRVRWAYTQHGKVLTKMDSWRLMRHRRGRAEVCRQCAGYGISDMLAVETTNTWRCRHLQQTEHVVDATHETQQYPQQPSAQTLHMRLSNMPK